MKPLDRDTLIGALTRALEPLDFCRALFEAGSAAFGRADAWSDVDLGLHVDDGAVELALEVVQATLESLSPVALFWRVPEPAWHGLSQVFYQLEAAGPHLLVDLCVSTPARPFHLRERERHGEPRVLFDKRGELGATALDWAAHQALIDARLATLRVTFPMFQTLVSRQIARRQPMDALWAWHGFVLRPLVELLRIRHDPARYDFGLRYLMHDLPPAVHAALVALAYVADPDDLAAKHPAAIALFDETLAALDAEI